eukprot:46636_1
MMQKTQKTEIMDGLLAKSITGWDDNELCQLESLLQQHKTFTKKNFSRNMNKILSNTDGVSLPNIVINGIKETINQFDVEQLHFDIKNGRDINEFRDAVINTVNHLVFVNEANKQKNNNDAYLTDDFVKVIYEKIANCFVWKNENSVSLVRKDDWVCYNCGNKNFRMLIGSTIRTNLSACLLCGISYINSLILALRGHDTFIMVNQVQHDTSNEAKYSHKTDEIDEMIETVIQTNKIDLLCLNKNNNKECESMVRLCKHLIIYKRWIQSIYHSGGNSDNINKTTQVDITKFIDDDTFKEVLIESAKGIKKITQDDLNLLIKMVDDNVDNVNVNKFVSMKMEDFGKMIKQYINTKKQYIGKKLYKKMLNSFKKK